MSALAHVVTLIQQRDELIECLADVIGWVPGDSAWHTNAPRHSVERARALLTKIRVADEPPAPDLFTSMGLERPTFPGLRGEG